MKDESTADDEFDPFADDQNAELREVERRMNIHRLKNEFQEITGVAPDGYENPDAPAEILEGYWEQVNEWERAPDSTLTEQWERGNAPLPVADGKSDEEVYALLWQLIDWLKERRTYVADTDHLSDRELYTYLREEAMTEWMKEFSPKSRMNCHLSPIGSMSADDIQIHLRFYADDAWRERWTKDWPQDFIPPKEKPPYDRDRLLPQADYGLPMEMGEDGFEGEFEDDLPEK